MPTAQEQAAQIARIIRAKTAKRARTEPAQITDMTSFQTAGFVWAIQGSRSMKVIARTLDCLQVGDFIFIRKMGPERWQDYIYDGFAYRISPTGQVEFDPTYCPLINVIIAWSGSLTTIPAGWLLCDGTNDTPDCRDLFVICDFTDATYNHGSNVVTATHSHQDLDVESTSTEATHEHAYDPTTGFSYLNGGGDTGSFGPPAMTGQDHVHPVDAADWAGTGAHNHLIQGESDATTVSVDIRQPWYALAYIKSATPTSIPIGSTVMTDMTVEEFILQAVGLEATYAFYTPTGYIPVGVDAVNYPTISTLYGSGNYTYVQHQHANGYNVESAPHLHLFLGGEFLTSGPLSGLYSVGQLDDAASANVMLLQPHGHSIQFGTMTDGDHDHPGGFGLGDMSGGNSFPANPEATALIYITRIR